MSMRMTSMASSGCSQVAKMAFPPAAHLEPMYQWSNIRHTDAGISFVQAVVLSTISSEHVFCGQSTIRDSSFMKFLPLKSPPL